MDEKKPRRASAGRAARLDLTKMPITDNVPAGSVVKLDDSLFVRLFRDELERRLTVGGGDATARLG